MAIRKPSRDRQSPRDRAEQLLRAGKPAEAAGWARETAKNTQDPGDLLLAASILCNAGDATAAQTVFERLKKAVPGESQVWYASACCLAASGRAEAACEDYRRYCRLVPDHVFALINFATALETGGSTEAAGAVLGEFRKFHPPSLTLEVLRGRLAIELKQHALARTVLAEALASLGDPPEAAARGWFNLGLACEAEGDLAAAENAWRRACASGKHSVRPVKSLAQLLNRQHRFGETLEWLAKEGPAFPDDMDLEYLAGWALRMLDRFDEAVLVLRRLVHTTAAHDPGWELLGRILQESGRQQEAAEVFATWQKLRPDSPVAAHMLAAARQDPAPDRAAPGFVGETFNRFAPSFDAVLEKLGYQGPKVFQQLLRENLGPPQGSLDVLDAGCGTGLIGPILFPYAESLAGVDLAQAMLDEAAKRGCYSRLHCGDLVEWLQTHPQTHDLIVAADTFNYFGNLEPLVRFCFAALRESGWLVFSLEEGDLTGEGYRLLPHGRFVHDPQYAMRTLGELGVGGGIIRRVSLRRENDREVFHLLVAVQKPAASHDSPSTASSSG